MTVAYDDSDLDVLVAQRSPDGDPAREVHDRLALDELLAGLPAPVVDAARSVAHGGLSWADACRQQGISPRVVEGHLRRYRHRRAALEEDR